MGGSPQAAPTTSRGKTMATWNGTKQELQAEHDRHILAIIDGRHKLGSSLPGLVAKAQQDLRRELAKLAKRNKRHKKPPTK
jgi:hypothetical protein